MATHWTSPDRVMPVVAAVAGLAFVAGFAWVVYALATGRL